MSDQALVTWPGSTGWRTVDESVERLCWYMWFANKKPDTVMMARMLGQHAWFELVS